MFFPLRMSYTSNANRLKQDCHRNNSIMHQETTSPQQPAGNVHQPAEEPAPSPASDRPIKTWEFASPGLTPARRYGTAVMLFVLGLFVIGVVFYEGRSAIASAALGLLLIAGFIGYLRMIAPAPFTLRITPEGLIRQEKSGDPLVISWGRIARVKEEQFPNGKIIGVMVYARSQHSVYRALVLYRDDLPQFDAFRAALKEATLPETPWQLETVHE
jgi:hypothetical protein